MGTSSEDDSLARVERLIGEAKDAGAYLVLEEQLDAPARGAVPQLFGQGGHRLRVFRFTSGYGMAVVDKLNLWETFVLNHVSEDGRSGVVDLQTQVGGNRLHNYEGHALQRVLAAARVLSMPVKPQPAA